MPRLLKKSMSLARVLDCGEDDEREEEGRREMELDLVVRDEDEDEDEDEVGGEVDSDERR